MFSHQFNNLGNNFCDFLFVPLDEEALPNGISPQRKEPP